MADLKISQLSAVSEVQGTDVFPTVSGLATMKASAAQIKTYVTESLDVNDSAVAGSYVTAVSEADGVISVTREAADVKPTANSTKMLTSGGAKAALDEKQNTLTFDNTPTANSNNPVRSGGVYTEVNSLKETLTNKVTGVASATSKASAAVVSMTDAMGVNAKKIVAKIEPVQAGSGTPSPSNVRAISGFDTVRVSATGKNLFNKAAIVNNAYLDTASGAVVTGQTGYCVSEFIPVKNGQTIFIPFSSSIRRWFYDSTKTAKTFINNLGAQAYTATEDGFIRVTIDKNGVSLDTYQIEYGSAATTYEPFGNYVTFSLSDTIYGGELDITTGVLTVTKSAKKLSDTVAWIAWGDTSHSFMTTWFVPKTRGAVISDSLKSATTESIYKGTSGDFAVGINTQGNQLCIYMDDSISTVEALNTYLKSHDIWIVYDINTPFTIQLTPQDIQLLEGLNNVYANSGNIAVDYYTQTVGNLAASVSQTQALDNEQKQNIYGLTANEYANGCVNLFNYNKSSYVIDGVTFTVNDDKTITINGKCTNSTKGYSDIKLLERAYLSTTNFKVGERYKISGVQGGSKESYRLVVIFYDANGGVLATYLEFNSTTLFTVPSNATMITVRIDTVYNVQLDNVVIKPMITVADMPNSDYAHYVPYVMSNRELMELLTNEIHITSGGVATKNLDLYYSIEKNIVGICCVFKASGQSGDIVDFGAALSNTWTIFQARDMSNGKAVNLVFKGNKISTDSALTENVNYSFNVCFKTGLARI